MCTSPPEGTGGGLCWLTAGWVGRFLLLHGAWGAETSAPGQLAPILPAPQLPPFSQQRGQCPESYAAAAGRDRERSPSMLVPPPGSSDPAESPGCRLLSP